MAYATRGGIRPRTFPSLPFFPEAGSAGKPARGRRLDRSALLRLNLAEHYGKEGL